MTGLNFHFFLISARAHERSDKTEIMEKLLKLLQTDRDMDFLLSLGEKDLTTLLIALRERMDNVKQAEDQCWVHD